MPDDRAVRLRMAARAVARAGLAHAYGHCSLRVDEGSFLVTPPRPLGLVEPADDLIPVLTAGPLPPAALPEVLAHQAIYGARPDLGAIVRFQAPQLMTLSTLGPPLHLRCPSFRSRKSFATSRTFRSST